MDEKEMLIKDLLSIHNIVDNPDFEDQVREILEKYIVFVKDRPPRKDINYGRQNNKTV